MSHEHFLHSIFSHHDGKYWTIICILLVIAFILFIDHRRMKAIYQKLLTQKKSSEVRTGKVAEVMAPFLDSFPVDVKKAGTSTVFLGQPIDYIHFDPEAGITFIEIKSGNADLTIDQKKIKKTIEAGKVFWKQVQINGD